MNVWPLLMNLLLYPYIFIRFFPAFELNSSMNFSRRNDYTCFCRFKRMSWKEHEWSLCDRGWKEKKSARFLYTCMTVCFRGRSWIIYQARNHIQHDITTYQSVRRTNRLWVVEHFLFLLKTKFLAIIVRHYIKSIYA